MKKTDWLNKSACELPGLSNRTRNAMERRSITVRELLNDFDRLKPSRIGGPPHRFGYGAGKKAVQELREVLKKLGFNHNDHVFLGDNPNELIVRGLQDKYGLSRKQSERFSSIAIKEGWISPPIFED